MVPHKWSIMPSNGIGGGTTLCAVAGFALMSGLTGCTVGPDFHHPMAPQGAGYISTGVPSPTASAAVAAGNAQYFIQGEDIPGQWWTLFHSAPLNALINEALKANPSVAAAQAALLQARENLYADQGSFFPTISGTASATREKASGASLDGSSSFGGSSFSGVGSSGSSSQVLSLTAASLSVAYSPDVFGGVRRQVESAAAQAEYQRFELEATYLTLTANVVNSAVTVASVRDQIAATDEMIKVESNLLAIEKSQFALGSISMSDVLAQQTTLAQTLATLPPLQDQLGQARDQLSDYLGRFPNQDQGENFTLASLSLPEDLPVSLPSALIEQRPDVLSSEAQLHEASANVGVAIANQLPQFSITGELGNSSFGFASLFTPASAIWSIGGSITQTIFDGGTLEHHKRAAVAAYVEAAAQYRGTVLSAFQDVANALRALKSDADALQADTSAEQSALASLNLSRTQYQLGAVDYLTLLNAEQSYQSAVLAQIRAQAARYSDTVALFQALGGGWWNRSDVAPASEGTPGRITLPPVQDIHLVNLGGLRGNP